MTDENLSSSPSRTSGDAWQPPTPERIQALFPQYEIVGLLGRGGMGAVYKGWQRSLDRFVAIKILPPGLTDDSQYSERFKQEAKSMAKLSHPGIVAVFDAGETPDGMLYFVMEFIEGTDVQKMIAEQGMLQSAHAMAITAHVCDALQYAHDRGIIHRDIKPANIMIGYDGAVKVADFGLAKQQQEGVSGLTQSGMVMGTLHYMAPESLILGVSVDHRADIYAVGIMLYQMLTGRLPQGLFEMPSQKVPGLDTRYDAVVAKAIREDRDIRYQSAAELRADLDSILTQPVVKVDPQVTQAPAALPTVARPRKPQTASVGPAPKSRPTLWATVAAVVVIIATAAFIFLRPDKAAQKIAQTGEPASQAPTDAPTTNAAAEKTEPASPMVPPTVTEEKKNPPKQPGAAPAPPVAKPAPAKRIIARPNLPSIPLPPEIEKQVASFEAEFQKAVQGKPEADWQAAMRDLNQKYLAAIDRASAEATAKGQLENVLALKDERQLLEKKQPVPSEVDEATQSAPTPQVLQNIRSIYRAEQAKHDNAKSQAIAAAFDDYRKKLDTLQASLTQAGRIDEAVQLKPVFDLLNERKQHDTAFVQSSASFINSLGMRFVSVPGTKTLMCVHETRYIDYAAFAREDTASAGRNWSRMNAKDYYAKEPFDAYPCCDVTFNEASAFCAWLSKKEGRRYRLPTDREWSIAVGCAESESQSPGTTPAALHSATSNLFPWGAEWPPPLRIGNYRDLTAWTEFPMKDVFSKPEYDDGYCMTSPVMSFLPNPLGIYDLGGNVLEWCEDWYDETQTKKVARGSCWYRGANNKAYLNSRSREAVAPGFFNNGCGFRVMVEAQGVTPATKPVIAANTPATPSAPAEAPATGAVKDAKSAKAPTVEPLVSLAVFFATTGQVNVTGKDGTVSDAGRAAPPPEGAAVTTAVTAGGSVKTGQEGSAELAMVGGGSLHLDADSEMIFDAANEGRPAVESLELRKGRLFIHIDAADLARIGRTHLQIKTPVSVVAIQGGKCYIEIGASYETIGVFKGSVEVTETQSGSKVMVKDDTTLAAKPGRLSPPQRLTMAQTAFRKVCDQIELVRTEVGYLPLDEVLEKTLNDLYFFTYGSKSSHTDKFASVSPVSSPQTKVPGALLIIKQNNLPKLRLRTVEYSPKIDMARFKQEIVAVELGCRSDGVTQLAPDLKGHDPDSGLFDIIPFGANYAYYLGRRIRLKAGTGNMGDWTNRIYPLYPRSGTSKLKFIRPTFYLYMREDDSYFISGRQEYRLELTPLVVITRKQQP